MSPEETDRLDSLHVAAHVVVAVYNGFWFSDSDVTIGQGPSWCRRGCRMFLARISDEPGEKLVRELTAQLAGDAAERRLGRWRPPVEPDDGGGDAGIASRVLAFRFIDRKLKFAGPDAAAQRRAYRRERQAQVELELARAQRRAREQVRRLWKPIRKLSRVVLERRTLNVADLPAHVYALFSESELKRIARRTGEKLSFLLLLRRA